MEDQDYSFGQAEARLWVKWVFSNYLAALFFAVLSVQVPGLARGELALIGGFLVSLPCWGLILATMQWLVLRRWLPRFRGWLIATAAGVLLYLPLYALTANAATATWNGPAHASNVVPYSLPAPWTGIVTGALLGAAIGIAQWIVLRRRFSGAGWWILATTSGWAVAGVGSQASGCLAGLAGLAPAALTGVVLVWLSGQPTREAPKTVPPPVLEERPRERDCPHCAEQVSTRAVVCRHCKGWLVDWPQAVEAGQQPAQRAMHDVSQGRVAGLVFSIALGALVALALPTAALVTRGMACGPLHSSVIAFAVLALVCCAPAAALPSALAWSMGRRRAASPAEAEGFSYPRALVGGLLGGSISFAVGAVCAFMTFFPECM